MSSSKYFPKIHAEDSTTVLDWLTQLSLERLEPAFTAHGITDMQRVSQITPADLDAMGVTLKGFRQRILSASSLISKSEDQQERGRSQSNSSAGNMEVDAEVEHKQKFNSTSSLFIDSTVSCPNLKELMYCTSLLLHDIIVEDDLRHRSGIQSGQNPFAVFMPRDIFVLPGKRKREEMETDQPIEVPMPSEDEILTAIKAIYAVSCFSPPCAVIAVIYIERIRRRTGAALLPSTWEPIVLISIIVAQKVWEDRRACLNSNFTTICSQLTLQQINTLELSFLEALDFAVSVSASVYTEWHGSAAAPEKGRSSFLCWKMVPSSVGKWLLVLRHPLEKGCHSIIFFWKRVAIHQLLSENACRKGLVSDCIHCLSGFSSCLLEKGCYSFLSFGKGWLFIILFWKRLGFGPHSELVSVAVHFSHGFSLTVSQDLGFSSANRGICCMLLYLVSLALVFSYLVLSYLVLHPAWRYFQLRELCEHNNLQLDPLDTTTAEQINAKSTAMQIKLTRHQQSKSCNQYEPKPRPAIIS